MKINLIFPLFFVLLLSSISSFAQQADRPETVFELDLDEIGQRLLAAPDFSKKSAHASGPAIELAMPNGQMKTFRFFKTHPMHPASVAFTLNNVISWNNQDVTGTGTASSSYAFDGPISGFVPVTNYSLLQGQNPTGTGNLDGTNTANDPDFVTPLAPSGAPSTAGDFHLQSGSPALDVGTNTNFPADTYDVDDDSNTTEPTPDLDLNDRIANTTIDLGPYEGGGGSCTPPTMNFPTVNQPTCGIPTGTIAVNATGNGPLEYSVDDGANWQSSGTFTGLAPGSYNLKARLQSDPTYMASWMFNGGETLDFDGTDDHVVLPANLTASLTDFTFEAWVYWDGATNWQRIMDFGENTNVWMFLTPQAGGTNNPSFAITTSSSGGSQSINSSVAAAVGQWQHYAVVLDAAANTGTLYIDGAQAGQNTNLTLSPSDLGNLSNNYLGKSQFSFDPYFDGKLDEVRIWDFAKTAAEVNCQKDVELLGTEPGLVAYYHFNQGTAGGNNAGVTTLDDLTTNNNDGTLTDFALTGTGSNWVEPGAPASGSVLFVNDDASGDNDGSSWANAFNDLQDAMATAAGCSNITQIWVAAGTYRPTSGTDRTISFVMQNDLAIYGGFAGTETMLSERDWVANVTTLSGDIGTPGDNTDNSYHVVANDNNGLNGTALLDGFTISGGNGNGGFPNESGGGMYNVSSSPTVTNCTFSGNSANVSGGGMYNISSSSMVTNCAFSGNSANQAGGGMYNASSSPTVTNCSFSGNSASYGGGMYNDLSSPTVTNCSFSGNNASQWGGGMTNASSSSSTVTNCSFFGNNAGSFGGGMYNSVSSPMVTNCSFSGNNAGIGGGGMRNVSSSSSPTVTNCIFWGNAIEIENVSSSTPTVTYSIVQGGYAGTGNIDADPLFVDQPPIGLGTSGDLRLQASSCAIDNGLNSAVPTGVTTDLDGNDRFYNAGQVDMGAYEFQGNFQAPVITIPPTTTNYGLHFDGTDDHVKIYTDCNSNTLFPGGDAITVEYWFKGTNSQSAVRLQNGGGYIVTAWGNSQHILSNDGGTAGISAGSGFDDGNWHHLAFTWQRNTADGFRSYLDGQLVEERQASDNPLPAFNSGFHLGSYIGISEFTSGTLDEVRIWTVARTAAEIQESFCGGLSGPQAGLLHEFVFNHGMAGGNNTGIDVVENTANTDALGLLHNFALSGSTSNWVDGKPVSPIRYVTEGGTGDGTSWTNASGDLQAMIDACGVDQVWVAQGTYKPTSGTDRTISFVMKNDVAIYGGFAGTETMLGERDWVANVTTLSGDIGTPGDNTDNSYHVISNDNNGLNASALLDGFTISGGNANGLPLEVEGGGMYNLNAAPTVNNCFFTSNSANGPGGGMYNFGSSFAVTNCIFSGNASLFNGGGGMSNTNGSLTVTNCAFIGNSAEFGGGIYNTSSPATTIINCSFSGNLSTIGGGGGISNENSFPTVTNSIFWGNSSEINDNTGANTTVNFSIVQGGWTGTGGNNLDVDPLFVSQPPIGLGTTGDLHLQACSPAKDAGTATGAPATDFDGDARPQGAGFDMGFDENGDACSNCVAYAAMDTPINIVDNTTITSTITVSETGTLDDVNVLNLNGTHTFTGDLTFTLTSPQGTSVVLIDGQCGGDDDFDLTLDDDAANPFACPINIGSTMQPQNPLSAFDGEDPAGDWVLSVADNAGDDQGTLQGWTLEICGDFTTGNCPPTLNVTGTIPSGTFQAQNSLTSDGTVPNGNTVELKAGSEVLLNANFEVSLGGILEVTIGACTP